MFRSALRSGATSRLSRSIPHNATSKRFLTTAPPHKTSRSWKNSAARWALAGGLIYYYNTSTVFAEEPLYTIHSPPETSRENETYATVDSIAEKRREQARSQAQSPSAPANASVATPESQPGSPEGLEQEAEQQGAFNEETGEINWDCPCLGGMAYGPCGEQFRAAFSCFVFSQEEPKGIDCIDKFKGMQDCFREHPDVYGAELEDADAPLEGEEAPAAAEGQGVPTPSQAAASAPHEGGEKVSKPVASEPEHVVAGKQERANTAAKEVKQKDALSESDEMVPKAWHKGVDAETSK